MVSWTHPSTGQGRGGGWSAAVWIPPVAAVADDGDDDCVFHLRRQSQGCRDGAATGHASKDACSSQLALRPRCGRHHVEKGQGRQSHTSKGQ